MDNFCIKGEHEMSDFSTNESCEAFENNNGRDNSTPGDIKHGHILSGRYRIVERVGKGGMGAVYKAEDLRLNSTIVAVKEMLNFVSSPEKLDEAVEGFKREANMLVNLRHKALPRVTDFFPQDGKWFLVMDFIEGETLQQVIDRRGRIPEDEVANWFGQLADVFGYLHNHRPAIIFRDLKPSNVMLAHDNEIKLIDFGIARHFNPINAQDTELYVSNGFAPPEQYGWKQTSPRSDIYALGALLHYLLTGIDPRKDPFHFVPPQSAAKVSDSLSSAIMKAVEYNPEDRQKSVHEMMDMYSGTSSGEGNSQVIEDAFLKKLFKVIGIDLVDDEEGEEKNKEVKRSFSKFPLLLGIAFGLAVMIWMITRNGVNTNQTAGSGTSVVSQTTQGSTLDSSGLSDASAGGPSSAGGLVDAGKEDDAFKAGDVIRSFEKDLNNDNIKEKVSLEYAGERSVYLHVDDKRKEITLPVEVRPYITDMEMYKELAVLDSVPEKDSKNEEIIFALHMPTADRGLVLIFAGGFNYEGQQQWSFDEDYPMPRFEVDYKGNRVVNIKIPDYGVTSDYIYVHTDYTNTSYGDYDFKKVFSSVGDGQNLCKVVEYSNFTVGDFDKNGEKGIETTGELWYYYKGDYLLLCNLVTRYQIRNEQLVPVGYSIESFDE